MPNHIMSKSHCLVYQFLCLLLYCLYTNSSNVKCLDKERDALLKLKSSIEVDRCGLLSSWGNQEENKDCCKWRGVKCNNLTGNVVILDLHGINTSPDSYPCLEGNINPSLLKLKDLNFLDLSYNDFKGQPIPSFLGSLTNLKHLKLSHTGFWGEVPHQLGNLSKLQSFHLSCPIMSPFCIHVESLQWLSHVTTLRHIDFSHIDLSKARDWLQVINNLPSLTFLRMNTCKLSLLVAPTYLPQQNKSSFLLVLDLGNNNLNSSMYQWLFNSSGFASQVLELINLSQNQLEGPIPDTLGYFHALKHLDLSANRLECPIPNSIGNLKYLEYLALSNNQLHGCSLPPSFGNLSGLKSLLMVNVSLEEELSCFIKRLLPQKSLMVLDLSGNRLSGSLPDISYAFPALRELSVDKNELNGTLSRSVGQLSQLERLSMSSTSMRGTISDLHFEKLSKLKYLDLSNNSLLAFKFSSNWIPPFQLDTIKLCSCKLGHPFPNWLLTQRNFSHMDVSDADISRSIPASFWKNLPSSQLSYMNMSHNNISGMIPNLSITLNIFHPPEIDLSFNSFEGAVPSFLGNASLLSLNDNMFSDPFPLLCPTSKIALVDLDLSNNLLYGKLPDECWMNMDRISFFNLESNKFFGNLPASLGTLRELQSFRLCDNNFSGELPMSLQNCTSLVILDIGDNRFSGYIPTSIGDNLQNLVVLNLRKNKFHGSIPSSFGKLSYLQMLDLSGNYISGVIPKWIYNFTAMTNDTNFLTHLLYANSSQSRLKYPYGAWVGWKRVQQKFGDELGLVKSINVSTNQLEGEIPREISCLMGLVSLDLSKNNLTGSITSKIDRLTSLELLDLSNNHLHGEIPTSLANLSFLAILDLSNNNLSGKIPTGTQLQGFDASTYEGNPNLCGAPLPNKCKGDEPTVIPEKTISQEEKDSSDIFPGLYISVTIGFVTGFWSVCGSLVLKKSWREALFNLVFSASN